MSDLNIVPINTVNIHKILSSPKLTNSQKEDFIKKNEVAIKQVMKTEISKSEFNYMMENRPLIRFRPFKNSFTKRGDKILLAKSLDISLGEITDYIDSVVKNNFKIGDNLTEENIEKVKTYVYRHGKKDQVVAFLEHELSDPKKVLTRLYRTLDSSKIGVASYFSRPIHRMNNNTLIKLYNVINEKIKKGCNTGEYSQDKYLEVSKWALIRIYQIQNDSKLIRTYQAKEEIE